jgi:hypothetical protein
MIQKVYLAFCIGQVWNDEVFIGVGYDTRLELF